MLAMPAMLAIPAMPAMPAIPAEVMPNALLRNADMAPGRMAGSKLLAAHPDWWPPMPDDAWPIPNWLMDEWWLLWWEDGGGVLQTAVSANDQILGLLGGMGMPDLPSSTAELLPALLPW
jgi:hypothetical protein